MQVSIKQRDVGQLERFIQLVGHLDATEAARRGEQAFPPQNLPAVHRVGLVLVAELHGVLEHLDEARSRVGLADRPHVHHEAVAGDAVPLFRQCAIVRRALGQRDHVQVRMPFLRLLATLEFIAPDGALNAIERAAASPVLAHPQLTLRLVQVPEPFGQVRAILDRQSDQKRPQGRFLGPDDLPPVQVGFEGLGAPSDRAQWAQQVLTAEPGTMQPDLIDGEVVPKRQIFPAVGDRAGHVLMARLAGHILGDVESFFLCFAVTINPSG